MAAVPSIGRAAGLEPRATPSAQATAHLYERYSGPIFGFCFNQLGSREEAEDATQSTFLNAHRALERGTTPEAAGAWLFKIAHNVCLSRRRSAYRRRRVEAPSDLQAVQDLLAAPQREGSEDLLRLTDALAHMPDNQRRAILLREWQGLSYREIGDELGLSQPAVETLIFRARRTLAGNLEQAAGRSEPAQKARKALDLGAIATLLKGLLTGGSAVKTAATAVAVTGAAVAVTAPAPDRHAVASHAAKVALTAQAPVRSIVRRTASAIPGSHPSTPLRTEPPHLNVSTPAAPLPVQPNTPAPTAQPEPPQAVEEPQAEAPQQQAPVASDPGKGTPKRKADEQPESARSDQADEDEPVAATPETEKRKAKGKDKAKDEPGPPAEAAQAESDEDSASAAVPPRSNGKGRDK